MPRGDGTGPIGLGTMTGRAAGYCAGYSAAGYANPVLGRRGRGFKNMHFTTGHPAWARYSMGAYSPDLSYAQPVMTASREAVMLKNQAKFMQDTLNALNERIEELDKIEAEKEKPKK